MGFWNTASSQEWSIPPAVSWEAVSPEKYHPEELVAYGLLRWKMTIRLPILTTAAGRVKRKFLRIVRIKI